MELFWTKEKKFVVNKYDKYHTSLALFTIIWWDHVPLVKNVPHSVHLVNCWCIFGLVIQHIKTIMVGGKSDTVSKKTADDVVGNNTICDLDRIPVM